nr:unnamed protein product [Spirometra erinaceieuropaei]
MPNADKKSSNNFSAKLRKTLRIHPKAQRQISVQWTFTEPATPPVLNGSDRWVVALNDNWSDQRTLEFKKGDILHLQKQSGERWWEALNSRTNKCGLVLDKWFTDRPGESVAFDAWQNIDREGARRQLLVPELQSGTFILRPGKDLKSYVLCVLYVSHGDYDVKFYQIQKTEDGERYYIRPEQTFSTLDGLLKFYSDPNPNNPWQLCCPLKGPRPKPSTLTRDFESKIISRHLLERKRDLGHGNYGRVFLATYRNTEVAVKEALGPQTTKESIDEAKLLSKLSHPRIMCLLGICCEPNTEPLLLITEFMPKGTLLDFFKTDEGKAFSVDDLIKVISQVCEGMAYLETNNVVHNDLRAANVLVDANNNVRVADFGLAKILRFDDRDINTGQFPIRWTAPEATASNYSAVSSADVWSFGVLMYEVLSYGSLPYTDLSDDEVLGYVESGGRLENPCKPEWLLRTDLYNVMTRCWNTEPKSRPTFQALQQELVFTT